jgi:hypothetical protein
MEGQAEQHLTWWRKNKQLLITVTVVIIVLIVAFALAVYKFGWDWIGFNGGYGQITTTSTSQGTTREDPLGFATASYCPHCARRWWILAQPDTKE